jgi:hypothetical protein
MSEHVWKVVELDESPHWPAGALASCGGTIKSVYVFDETRAVHCCELTPSRELWFSHFEPASMPESETAREAVFDMLLAAAQEAEAVSYMHVRRVDALKTREPQSDDECRAIENALEVYDREQ